MNTKEMTIENNAILIADSHHGQYIPQLVTQSELNNPLWDWSKVSEEDIASLLAGPEDEFYWDAWSNAESNIKITSEGIEYFLCQNEDLWAIPEQCAERVEDWLI